MILLGALVGIVSTVLLVGAFFAGRARGYKTGYAKGLADTAYLYDAASGQPVPLEEPPHSTWCSYNAQVKVWQCASEDECAWRAWRTERARKGLRAIPGGKTR